MTMPTGVTSDRTWFDKFATATEGWVSKAPFFFACVLLVIVWGPTFVWLKVDTWQLVINTVTTIITFLLVALLQNTQKRGGDALHAKLNAIAAALIDVLEQFNGTEADIAELKTAIGLEGQVGT